MKKKIKLLSTSLFSIFFFLSIAGCNKSDKENTESQNKEEIKKVLDKKEEYRQIKLQELSRQGLPPNDYNRRYKEIMEE